MALIASGRCQLQRIGRRSEKLDPEELPLALADIEQAIAGNEARRSKRWRRRSRR